MTDTPDWKKAIDRGTSMHTILAEKKSAEGPDSVSYTHLTLPTIVGV